MSRRPLLALIAVALLSPAACRAPSQTRAEASPQLQRGPGSQTSDSVADESAQWSYQSLTGHWEGDVWRINSRGPSLVRDRIHIQVDGRGLIEATRTWETLEGAGGHKGLTPVKGDSEDLIGVFDPVTGKFHLVEMDEPGTIQGHMVDQDTIQFISTQPGRQPSISNERLTRVDSP